MNEKGEPMKESSVLRLALVVRGGQSSSFEKNLLKIVSMVLYDSSKSSMTAYEICEAISTQYELEFTEDEVVKAVNRKDSEIIRTVTKKHTTKQGTNHKENIVSYSLNTKTIEKYKRNDDDKLIERIIGEFFEETSRNKQRISEFKELLLAFLYNTFSVNKDTLMLFLRGEQISIPDESENEYDVYEKELLNDFLNWDNTEKNEIIFLAASYCVEYCMLTIKKDFSSYKDIFRGKKFYLDSNIIFRLAGVNNEERRVVIKTFIDKCVREGIKIKYTNFTNEEIKETVKRNVEAIRNLSGGYKLVSVERINKFTQSFVNLSFLNLYDEWSKKPGTKYNDYNAFQRYVMGNIEAILRGFKKENFISFETSDADFSSYCSSLYEYKNNHNARCNNASVKIDVNNYLYVFNLRKKAKGGTFIDISDYLISADANLCEWGKTILPSSIPVVVLPSVWYSLILKFKGRTENDYKAFSLFLNLRYRLPEKFDERKPEILKMIQGLDEPVDLKNMMLDDITDNLEGAYNEIGDIETIVEKSKKSVIQKEAQRLYETEGTKIKITSKEEGVAEILMKLAESKTNKKVARHRIISKVIDIIRGCTAVILVTLIAGVIFGGKLELLSKFIQIEFFDYPIADWIEVTGGAVSLIGWLGLPPLKKWLDSRFDAEAIKMKEYSKLKKEMIV